MTDEQKKTIQSEYRLNPKDTGSADVQVAVLTARIEELTAHLKIHKKDFSTRRGLIHMVNNRRSLLDYLARTDKSRYEKLIQRLKIRK